MPGHISQKLAERRYITDQILSNEASVLPPSKNCCPLLLSIKAVELLSGRPLSEGGIVLVLLGPDRVVVRERVQVGVKFKKSR